MKTTYFGKLRSLDPTRFIIVPVCAHPPKGVVAGGSLPSVIPSWQRLVRPYKDGLINETEYESMYLRQLDGNRDEILRQVRALAEGAGGKEILLCCFEKSSDWCHRHILAGWLRKEGFDVDEL